MSERGQTEANDENPQQAKLDAYIRELLAEKAQIDEAKFPNAHRLIDDEIQRAQVSNRAPFKDQKFVDIYRERPVKVSVKVLVPIKEHPRYNFVGKLLGPKGNTLKQLQEETMCHISICGRGSIRDRQKEEELRQSLELKYAHLHDDLHLDINTLGPPAEAHARIAFALAEVRKYLIPEYGDGGRPEALMEFMSKPKQVMRDDRPPPGRKPPGLGRGGMSHGHSGPSMRQSRGPMPGPNIQGKNKVMSILDKARVAMEDYEEDYDEPEQEYEGYRGRPSGAGRSSYPPARGGYNEDYESDYYRGGGGGGGGGHYSTGGPDFGYKKRKTFMD